MLLNLPNQLLDSVTFRFGIVDAFLIQLFDQSGLTQHHRKRQIMARIIQKNWRIYWIRKNAPPPPLLQVYARSYDFLSYTAGMGGLAFSN